MAYAQLKSDIAAVIRNNGNQEITGNVLQGALLEIINALGANYQYAGVADTSTTITTTEANVFYLLTEAGTYANMSSSIVHTSGIGIALWNGTAWSYQNVPSTAFVGDVMYYVTGEVEKELTWSNGYINSTGTITSSSVSKFTQPFLLKKGEQVTIGTNNTNITIIASTTADSLSIGNSVTPIEKTTASATFQTFTYTATEDIKLTLCVKWSDYTLSFKYADCYKDVISDVDDTPREGSLNLVRSGGVYDAEVSKSGVGYAPLNIGCPYILGGINVSNGTLVAATDRCRTRDKIFVEPSSNYQIYTKREINSETQYIFEYATNDSFIKRTDWYQTQKNTFTTSATTAYIRLSTSTAQQDPSAIDLIVTKGNVRLPNYMNVQLNNVEYPNLSPKYQDFGWELGKYINNDGVLTADTNWCASYKIPIAEGDTIRWKSGYTTTIYTISCVIFNSSDTKLDQISVGVGGEQTITAGEGASYAIASFYKPSANGYLFLNDKVVVWFDPTFISFLTNQLSQTTLNGILTTQFLDVVHQNKHKESALVNTLLYKGNTDIKDNNKLSILQFSDIHGDANELRRIVAYRDYYNEYIDYAIHTGDTVDSVITQPNVFDSVDGANTILNVAGNHDAWLQTSDTDYLATPKQVYDKIFANDIADWGVVQPANAATEGYCYYYKDTRNYRMIVLDSVHWHTRNNVADDASVQKAWFEGVLADAITNNKIVVCATHYTPVNGITFVSGVEGWNPYGYTDIQGDGWYASDEIFTCVDTFISGGGKFAGWIVGHTHRDYFGKVTGHTGQYLICCNTCGKDSLVSKMVDGTNTADDFDIVTFSYISASQTLIKLVKIGNDRDMYNRYKGALCFDTATETLIWCDK